MQNVSMKIFVSVILVLAGGLSGLWITSAEADRQIQAEISGTKIDVARIETSAESIKEDVTEIKTSITNIEEYLIKQ